MTQAKTAEQRQRENERRATDLGISRYRARQLPWQMDSKERPESEGIVGRRIMGQSIEPVSKRIQEYITTTLHTKKRGGARKGLHVARMMEAVGPDACAFAGIKVLIDRMHKPQTLGSLGDRVGKLLETQYHIALMDDGTKSRKSFARITQKNASTTTNARYRGLIVAGALKKLGEEPPYMPADQRMQLGVAVLNYVYEETGLVEFDVVRRKQSKEHLVYPTKEAVEWMENQHAQAEKLFPLRLPMVCPPKPWTGPYGGGYLTKDMRLKLVKTRNRNYLEDLDSEDIDKVLQAVNAVQETPWRINKPVLDVVKQLWDDNSSVGKLPLREPIPMPAKPEDIDTNEVARKQWRAEAATIHNKNAALLGKRAATSQKLWIAQEFRDEEYIYFPHQLDWRCRLYPAATMINPQGDDLTKSLIEFGRGKPLGEDGPSWLAVQLANTWGEDKVSLDDRVQWVEDHHDMILDCAMFPIEGQMRWTEADKPFQFLAACFEWLGYTIEGPSYISRQPVAMDGSCSGLQHFSAMLLDPVGGEATNLVPMDLPQDIYQRVADKVSPRVIADAQDGVEEALPWVGNVCRKVTKRPTMTLPYGVTQYGMKDQIKDFLTEQEADRKPVIDPNVDKFHAARYITPHIDRAIGETVTASKVAMDWLQQVAKVAASDGLPVSWVTPVGFPVLQSYMQQKTKQINCHFGGVKVKPSVSEETDKLNTRRQSSGIAPNYVHSMDAAHLIETVAQATDAGIEDFAMIHDSFGTHACDAAEFGWLTRKSFVDQYTPDRLAEFREQIRKQLPEHLQAELPEVPERGDLELDRVMESMYFFA